MAMLDTSIPQEWKDQWQTIVEHLRDPLKLRIATLSVVTLVGMAIVYKPMSDHIAIQRRELKAARDRLNTVRQIETLRATKSRLLTSLPPTGDANFWTEHYLDGIRESGVQLRHFEARPRTKIHVGTFQGLELDIEVEGTYHKIFKLLAWIEHNQWFARILEVRFKKDPTSVMAMINVAIITQPEKTRGG